MRERVEFMREKEVSEGESGVYEGGGGEEVSEGESGVYDGGGG